jgi:hypothetical protein
MSLPSGSPTKISYAFLISSMRATKKAYLKYQLQMMALTNAVLVVECTRVYPKVSGLDAWSENCK